MMGIVNFLLVLLAAPAVLPCLYVFCMTLLSAKLPVPARSSRQLRFDVFVPAHNEAASIERVVASLLRLDWPRDRFRVSVIADNCTDATASLARAAGALVLERFDECKRGKGYALDFAFQDSRAQRWSDAIVVVDADSESSSNLLEAFASRIAAGAHAVQAHYGVLNPWSSWRTRLMTIAQAAFHVIRSRARSRLKLSCGLRGNGWCVTHEVLRQVPYRAFSLTEDIEYGIDLGLAGYRIEYADEAHVDGEMVSRGKDARIQRQRWEAGRFQLIRSRTVPLLRAAFQRRDRICLDLALDLLVLPLSFVALSTLVLLIAAAVADAWWPSLRAWLWVAVGCCVSLTCYVMRGWQLSGTGVRGLLDLAASPVFLAWKVILMASRREAQGWVRTDREKQ
jgi:cellulose synthase/poly-beta-1,6-N-acetylglucosamine synthase-like glycosyltransferase